MALRTYGQFCGLAKALELIGERWALLVVRDLVLGPKRYTELQAGLPRIPSSILSARLNELEQAGVVRRRILPELDASVVYELTEYGGELEPALLQLGLWGARSLDTAATGDVFTLDSAILSLYTTFRPEYATGVRVCYELRYGPDLVVSARVDDGALTVSAGPASEADLVVVACGPLLPILTGDITAADAVAQGLVHIVGHLDLLDLMARLFHVPAAPMAESGLALR